MRNLQLSENSLLRLEMWCELFKIIHESFSSSLATTDRKREAEEWEEIPQYHRRS